jgi:hypothetical protein
LATIGQKCTKSARNIFGYGALVFRFNNLATAPANLSVGNQQEWDTFVKERSGGDVSVLGLPEQVVVAFAAS